MPRSAQQELLDKPNLPFEDIRRNMKELDFINTWLGGHHVTISGLKQILCATGIPGSTLQICETGCGGGDNLRVIQQWCSKNNIPVHLTGIDIKKECIDLAKSHLPGPEFSWITSDYRQVDFGNQKPHILFSSLFCHHFSDEDIGDMMAWMYSHCTVGFFVNDLHRHLFAYYSIKTLTRYLSNSYLVKNDAPLSVLRGFRRKEWKTILQNSGISTYSLEWKWAFRWLLTVRL